MTSYCGVYQTGGLSRLLKNRYPPAQFVCAKIYIENTKRGQTTENRNGKEKDPWPKTEDRTRTKLTSAKMVSYGKKNGMEVSPKRF